MPKFLVSIVFLLLSASAWSQEDAEAIDAIDEDAIEDAMEETIDATADGDADLDGDLDQQDYDEDEDDFVPTEEIPVDEPIPFPSNI